MRKELGFEEKLVLRELGEETRQDCVETLYELLTDTDDPQLKELIWKLLLKLYEMSETEYRSILYASDLI